MIEVIKREKEYRNSYSNRTRRFTYEIEQNSNAIHPLIKAWATRGGLSSVILGLFGIIYNTKV
jgi:hypothetical protein